MIFSREAIHAKLTQIDTILEHSELVHAVVSALLGVEYTLKQKERTWTPGGGATLYEISVSGQRYFLKVKHESVLVESSLESEHGFSSIPSLRNEACFLRELAGESVPRVVFYEEREGYCFLAVEHLDPYETAIDSLTAADLLNAWEQLTTFVRSLFDRGIVHTDIHEFNICFRGSEAIVCDFEEARYLKQGGCFEESLDYCGRNRFGDVGEFPDGTGKGIAGLTCLLRLREVFRSLVRERLPKFLAECRFDQSCPFNADILQEEDPRIYQSVELPGITIAGQRQGKDMRQALFVWLLFKAAFRGPVYHLDIGSNLGVFCQRAASFPFVRHSTGLEAFEPYVVAAKALVFIGDDRKVSFHRFVCGEDDFAAITETFNVCTLLSVYHHIADKELFLQGLALRKPLWILAEFAVQGRYYPERGGDVLEEINYIRKRLGYNYSHELGRTEDYDRPLILFSDAPLGILDKAVLRKLRSGYESFLVRLITKVGGMVNKRSAAKIRDL